MATFVTNRVVDPNVPLTQDKLAPLSAAGNTSVKTIDQWLQQVIDVTAVTATLTPITTTRALTSQLILNTDFTNYQTSVASSTATLTPTSVTRTLTSQLVLNTDLNNYQTNVANTTATLTPVSVTRTLTSQLVLNTDFSNYQTNTTNTTATLTPITTTRTLTGQLVLNTDFTNYQTNVANTTATLTPTSVTRTLTSQLVLNTDFSNYQTSVASSTATLTPTSVTRTLTSQLVLNTDLNNYQTNVSNTTATLTPITTTRTLTGQLVLNTDSRLTDARTPTSHTHGNITNAGAIGATANAPIITTTLGVLTTGSFGSTANTFCQGNDIRLSDTRTPTDLSVTDGKVATNAAISGTKINPNFGSQNIVTTGNIGAGTVTPNQKLTVSGNISATGSITANSFSGNVNATNIGNGSVNNNKFQALSGVTSDIQIQLDSKISNTDFSNYRTSVANTTAILTPLTVTNTLTGLLTPTTVTRTLTSQLVLNTDFNNYRTSVANTTATLTPITTTRTLTGQLVLNTDSRLTDARTPTSGSVDNDKVSTNAAISGTKINPNFGSQNIVTTGNIGIGTTSPNQTLTVAGNISATGTIGIGTFSSIGGALQIVNNRGIRLESTNGYTSNLSGFHIFKWIDNNLYIDNYDKDISIRGLSGTQRMRITESGNVGIGSGIPIERLHVSGLGETILVTPVQYGNNQNSPYLIAGSTLYTGATADWGTHGFQHRFKSDSGGTPRITIDDNTGEKFTLLGTSGNVGIGVTNPAQRLTVSGSISASGSLFGSINNTSVQVAGTSTARSLADRFADVLNVKDFGAKGDGVTNDTAAINAAINYSYTQPGRYEILIPDGVFVINQVITSYTPIQIRGRVKCGYSPSAAGIRLAAQPIKISNYMSMYCNGNFVDALTGSPIVGTAALSGAIYDWYAHYPGFSTLDLEGWRVFVNKEIVIDANLVNGGGAGDFNERRFMCNGKLQADANFTGSTPAKNIFRLLTSNTVTTPRVTYLKFDNLSFELSGAANGVVCEAPYFNIHFTNCFFRNPLSFSLKFDAPLGASSSDVLVDSCTFIGNDVPTPPTYGVYYSGNDLQFNNNIVAYHKNNLAIIAKPGGAGASGIMVIDANHFYIGATSSTRRDPNILLQDCQNTNITNNYIDHGPVLYKQVALSACTDHTLLGNFFLYFISPGPPVPGFSTKFAFVEIEKSPFIAASPQIQRMNIVSNRFVNFAYIDNLNPTPDENTIQVPFSANFIPANNDTHVENSIKLNQFYFTQYMGTEIAATIYPNGTSTAITPPTWNSPFGLPIRKVRQYIPYLNSNPGGIWISGTAPNFTFNTGNSVTGTVEVLLAATPYMQY